MEKLSVHDKAIRLLEGGVVEADGLFVRCGQYVGDDISCDECDMDCLCHVDSEICDLCYECDDITKTQHILILVNRKN